MNGNECENSKSVLTKMYFVMYYVLLCNGSSKQSMILFFILVVLAAPWIQCAWVSNFSFWFFFFCSEISILKTVLFINNNFIIDFVCFICLPLCERSSMTEIQSIIKWFGLVFDNDRQYNSRSECDYHNENINNNNRMEKNICF